VNTVELILVILLSAGFLTLIVLSIILLSLMLAIMRNVKRMSERAEVATSSVANVMESLSRKVAPIAVSGVVTALMKRFMGKHNSKEGK
jgi:hypothetical protein